MFQTTVFAARGAGTLFLVFLALGCAEKKKGTPGCTWEDTFNPDECPAMGAYDQCVVHVDQDAESSGNGSSWAEAKRSLREAVDTAACGIATTSLCPTWQVWIKSGTHRVYQGCVEDTVRLRSNVELYGGFAGNEASLGERDPIANPTVVDGASEAGDANVNNVFVGQYVEEVVLDGLTIRGGAAFIDAYVASTHDVIGGGGVAFWDGSLAVHNCTFEDNLGTYGAAISFFTSALTVSGSTFGNNQAENRGGAVYGFGIQALAVEDSSFSGNSVSDGGDGGGGGGALFAENEGLVEIVNCDFTDNHAVEVLGEPSTAILLGGALGAMYTTMTIAECTFTGNTANLDGGAVKTMGTDLTMVDSSFLDNETVNGDWGSGAGLSLLGSTALVERCTFSGNSIGEVETDEYLGRGGGVEIYDVADAQIIDCDFVGNSVPGAGGAVTVVYSPEAPEDCVASFESSVFFDNSGEQGGGIYIAPEGGGVVGDISVLHSTFASNTATNGGADIYFIDSSDGAGSLDISSSILWSQTEPLSWEEVDAPPTVTYSDVCGGCTGEGNIDADPLFVDEENGDLHLSEGSPCIEAGEDGSDMGAFPYEG